MNSVISEIGSKVSPEAMEQGTPVALATGHINIGAAIYEALVVDAEKQGITTLEAIKIIALESGLSCTEFSAACKKSQEIADTTDKAQGFEVATDAKGIDRYGPKRRLLNQRLSEAKQLFGVYKLNPHCLEEKGYWSALAEAREYLASVNKKWDNTNIDSPDVKAAKAGVKLEQNVMAATMVNNPQQEGENRAEYLLRIDGMIDAAVDAAETEAFNKGVKSLFEQLTKKHGDIIVSALLDYSMGQADTATLESVQAWVQEELVLRAVVKA